MDSQTILAKLQPIFAEVFEDDTLSVNENLSQGDIENWDSLSHLHLIVAIEKSFGFRFSPTEVEQIQTVGDFVRIIFAKTSV